MENVIDKKVIDDVNLEDYENGEVAPWTYQEFQEFFLERNWFEITNAVIDQARAHWIPNLEEFRLHYTYEFLNWWFKKGQYDYPEMEFKVRKFVRILNVYRLTELKPAHSLNEFIEQSSESEEKLKGEFVHLVRAHNWKLLYELLSVHPYLFAKYCQKGKEGYVLSNLRMYNFTNKPSWEAFKKTPS